MTQQQMDDYLPLISSVLLRTGNGEDRPRAKHSDLLGHYIEVPDPIYSETVELAATGQVVDWLIDYIRNN